MASDGLKANKELAKKLQLKTTTTAINLLIYNPKPPQ